jgi:uncharacterized tellurite resistance protein B-like protein
MISAIRKLLQKNATVDKTVSSMDKEELIRMAAAVLFVEVMHADHQIDKRERQVIKRALLESFSLSKQDAEELLQQAEIRVKDVTSLHEFTSLLHGRLTFGGLSWRMIMSINMRSIWYAVSRSYSM